MNYDFQYTHSRTSAQFSSGITNKSYYFFVHMTPPESHDAHHEGGLG
jgi:hypothetical protein